MRKPQNDVNSVLTFSCLVFCLSVFSCNCPAVSSIVFAPHQHTKGPSQEFMSSHPKKHAETTMKHRPQTPMLPYVPTEWILTHQPILKERVPEDLRRLRRDSGSLGDIIFDFYVKNATMPLYLEKMLEDTGDLMYNTAKEEHLQPTAGQSKHSDPYVTQNKGIIRGDSLPDLDIEALGTDLDAEKSTDSHHAPSDVEQELQLFYQMFEDYLKFKAHRTQKETSDTRNKIETTCKKILNEKGSKEASWNKNQGAVTKKSEGSPSSSHEQTMNGHSQVENSTDPIHKNISKQEKEFSSFENLVKTILNTLPNASKDSSTQKKETEYIPNQLKPSFSMKESIIIESIQHISNDEIPTTKFSQTLSNLSTSTGKEPQKYGSHSVITAPQKDYFSISAKSPQKNEFSKSTTTPQPGNLHKSSTAPQQDIFPVSTTAPHNNDFMVNTFPQHNAFFMSNTVPQQNNVFTSSIVPHHSEFSMPATDPQKGNFSMSAIVPQKSNFSMSTIVPQKNNFSMSTIVPQKSNFSMSTIVPQKSNFSMSATFPQLNAFSMSTTASQQDSSSNTPTNNLQEHVSSTSVKGSQKIDLFTSTEGSHKHALPTPNKPIHKHGSGTPTGISPKHSSPYSTKPSQKHGSPIPTKVSQKHGSPTTSKSSQKHGSPIPTKVSQKHGSPTTSKSPQKYGLPIPTKVSQKHGSPTTSKSPQKYGLPIPTKVSQKHGSPTTSKLPQKHGSPITTKASQNHGSTTKSPQRYDLHTATSQSQNHSSSTVTKPSQRRGSPTTTKVPQKHSSHSPATNHNVTMDDINTALNLLQTGGLHPLRSHSSAVNDTEIGQQIHPKNDSTTENTRTNHQRGLLRSLIIPEGDLHHQDIFNPTLISEQVTSIPSHNQLSLGQQYKVDRSAQQDNQGLSQGLPEITKNSDIPSLENLMNDLDKQFSKRKPTTNDINNIKAALDQLNVLLSKTEKNEISEETSQSTTKEVTLKKKPFKREQESTQPKQSQGLINVLNEGSVRGLFIHNGSLKYDHAEQKRGLPNRETQSNIVTSFLDSQNILGQKQVTEELKHTNKLLKGLSNSTSEEPNVQQLEHLLIETKKEFSRRNPNENDVGILENALRQLDVIASNGKSIIRNSRSLTPSNRPKQNVPQSGRQIFSFHSHTPNSALNSKSFMIFLTSTQHASLNRRLSMSFHIPAQRIPTPVLHGNKPSAFSQSPMQKPPADNKSSISHYMPKLNIYVSGKSSMISHNHNQTSQLSKTSSPEPPRSDMRGPSIYSQTLKHDEPMNLSLSVSPPSSNQDASKNLKSRVLFSPHKDPFTRISPVTFHGPRQHPSRNRILSRVFHPAFQNASLKRSSMLSHGRNQNVAMNRGPTSYPHNLENMKLSLASNFSPQNIHLKTAPSTLLHGPFQDNPMNGKSPWFPHIDTPDGVSLSHFPTPPITVNTRFSPYHSHRHSAPQYKRSLQLSQKRTPPFASGNKQTSKSSHYHAPSVSGSKRSSKSSHNRAPSISGSKRSSKSSHNRAQSGSGNKRTSKSPHNRAPSTPGNKRSSKSSHNRTPSGSGNKRASKSSHNHTSSAPGKKLSSESSHSSTSTAPLNIVSTRVFNALPQLTSMSRQIPHFHYTHIPNIQKTSSPSTSHNPTPTAPANITYLKIFSVSPQDTLITRQIPQHQLPQAPNIQKNRSPNPSSNLSPTAPMGAVVSKVFLVTPQTIVTNGQIPQHQVIHPPNIRKNTSPNPSHNPSPIAPMNIASSKIFIVPPQDTVNRQIPQFHSTHIPNIQESSSPNPSNPSQTTPMNIVLPKFFIVPSQDIKNIQIPQFHYTHAPNMQKNSSPNPSHYPNPTASMNIVSPKVFIVPPQDTLMNRQIPHFHYTHIPNRQKNSSPNLSHNPSQAAPASTVFPKVFIDTLTNRQIPQFHYTHVPNIQKNSSPNPSHYPSQAASMNIVSPKVSIVHPQATNRQIPRFHYTHPSKHHKNTSPIISHYPSPTAAENSRLPINPHIFSHNAPVNMVTSKFSNSLSQPTLDDRQVVQFHHKHSPKVLTNKASNPYVASLIAVANRKPSTPPQEHHKMSPMHQKTRHFYQIHSPKVPKDRSSPSNSFTHIIPVIGLFTKGSRKPTSPILMNKKTSKSSHNKLPAAPVNKKTSIPSGNPIPTTPMNRTFSTILSGSNGQQIPGFNEIHNQNTSKTRFSNLSYIPNPTDSIKRRTSNHSYNPTTTMVNRKSSNHSENPIPNTTVNQKTTNHSYYPTPNTPVNRTTNRPHSPTPNTTVNRTTNRPHSPTPNTPVNRTTNRPHSPTPNTPMNRTTNRPHSPTPNTPMNRTTNRPYYPTPDTSVNRRTTNHPYYPTPNTPVNRRTTNRPYYPTPNTPMNRTTNRPYYPTPDTSVNRRTTNHPYYPTPNTPVNRRTTNRPYYPTPNTPVNRRTTNRPYYPTPNTPVNRRTTNRPYYPTPNTPVNRRTTNRPYYPTPDTSVNRRTTNHPHSPTPNTPMNRTTNHPHSPTPNTPKNRTTNRPYYPTPDTSVNRRTTSHSYSRTPNTPVNRRTTNRPYYPTPNTPMNRTTNHPYYPTPDTSVNRRTTSHSYSRTPNTPVNRKLNPSHNPSPFASEDRISTPLPTPLVVLHRRNSPSHNPTPNAPVNKATSVLFVQPPYITPGKVQIPWIPRINSPNTLINRNLLKPRNLSPTVPVKRRLSIPFPNRSPDPFTDPIPITLVYRRPPTFLHKPTKINFMMRKPQTFSPSLINKAPNSSRSLKSVYFSSNGRPFLSSHSSAKSPDISSHKSQFINRLPSQNRDAVHNSLKPIIREGHAAAQNEKLRQLKVLDQSLEKAL